MSLEFLESCLFSFLISNSSSLFSGAVNRDCHTLYTLPTNLLGPEIVPPFVLLLRSIVCVALVITDCARVIASYGVYG